jgi:hypothetical protein
MDQDREEKRPSASGDAPGRGKRAEARREQTEEAHDWAWRASQAFIAQACGLCAERLEESARELRRREAGR